MSSVDPESRTLLVPPITSLTDASTVGDFLSGLIAGVESGALVHVADPHLLWVDTGLRDLLAYAQNGFPIAQERHRELGRAVQGWIRRCLAPDRDQPILPYFAWAVAKFVADHYRGGTLFLDSGERIKIEGPVPDEYLGPFEFMENAKFKSDFTRDAGGLAVLAKVPSFGSVRGERRLRAGDEVECVLQKCPASSGFHDFVNVAFTGQAAPFDYFSAFTVYATFLEDDRVRGRLPLTWCIAQTVATRPGDEPGTITRHWRLLPEGLRADWTPAET